MSLMRLLLLFLLGIMLRRLLKPLWSRKNARSKGSATDGDRNGTATDAPGYADLTEQGIDDADFEEIP